MAKFDALTLGELRDVQEVAIRTEKHPKSAVVIWVVVADDEVFVRSWRGAKGRWYSDLAAGGPATLGVCRPPAGGAGAPGERPSCRRPDQPRIPRKYQRSTHAHEMVRSEPCRPRCGSNRADPFPDAGHNVEIASSLRLSQ